LDEERKISTAKESASFFKRKFGARNSYFMFGLDFMAEPFVPRNMVMHTSATIGINP
jgi:hypothetical protein